MLRFHYVPGGHGGPVSPKRGTPWNFGYVWSCCVSTMFPAATAVPFFQHVARRGTLVIYFSVNKFY